MKSLKESIQDVLSGKEQITEAALKVPQDQSAKKAYQSVIQFDDGQIEEFFDGVASFYLGFEKSPGVEAENFLKFGKALKSAANIWKNRKGE